jgi:hypothetical protein
MAMQAMERAAIIGQLVAMRNVLDGLLEGLERGEEADAMCEHPEGERKYPPGTTMGSAASFICQRCGQHVTDLSRIVRPTEGGNS